MGRRGRAVQQAPEGRRDNRQAAEPGGEEEGGDGDEASKSDGDEAAQNIAEACRGERRPVRGHWSHVLERPLEWGGARHKQGTTTPPLHSRALRDSNPRTRLPEPAMSPGTAIHPSRARPSGMATWAQRDSSCPFKPTIARPCSVLATRRSFVCTEIAPDAESTPPRLRKHGPEHPLPLHDSLPASARILSTRAVRFIAWCQDMVRYI